MEIDSEGIEIKKLEAFGVFQGATLLEVGCGDGCVTAQLAGRVNGLCAVDPCARDLMQAASRIDQALFSRASGEQLPFPEHCFDTVLFTLSLHHQNSRLALQEAVRVVVPTGRILVMEPTADGEFQQFFHLFEDESAALASALSAIDNSPLRVMRVTQFETEYCFESRHEFSRYMFAYHDQPRTLPMEAMLFRHLGSKAAERPLVLKDKLQLMCLVP